MSRALRHTETISGKRNPRALTTGTGGWGNWMDLCHGPGYSSLRSYGLNKKFSWTVFRTTEGLC